MFNEAQNTVISGGTFNFGELASDGESLLKYSYSPLLKYPINYQG